MISEIKVVNFRNHKIRQIKSKHSLVILTGNNGVGKTNLLEAVSLLTAGKGFRLSALENLINHASKEQECQIYADIILDDINYEIKITINHSNEKYKKSIILDSKPVKNSKEISNLIKIVSIIPETENLLNENKSSKIKFLDNIVGSIDHEHFTRLNAYEYHIRERMNLLKNHYNERWLDITEKKIAELVIAIVNSRLDIVLRLNEIIESENIPLIKPLLKLDGEIEQLIHSKPAITIEQTISNILYKNRNTDKERNRTQYGINCGYIKIIHVGKNIESAYCSTGEQKALLIHIAIAQAKLLRKWFNISPVLIFDEVLAHLDSNMQNIIMDYIESTGFQCWLSATNHDIVNVAQKYFSDFTHIKMY